LFLPLIFYPLFAVGSHSDNIFTAPYVPILVVIFCLVVFKSNNKILFFIFFLLIIYLMPNKFPLKYIRFRNPMITNQKVLSEMNNDLNLVTKDISDYCVYKCEGKRIDPNVGFYFYKVQTGESKKSYFDSICSDDIAISDNQENFLYSLDGDCKTIFDNERYNTIYDFERIFSKDGKSIYLITRK
jgi:hypothetical protein